jgi:stage V sporulation protein AD
MGSAMAGAACQPIVTHLTNTGKSLDDFDCIVTGDLGLIGSELLYSLCDKAGLELRAKHKDCGLMLYNLEQQDVHGGGSGCGCAAAMLCGYFLQELAQGKLQNILFVATGALMSPTAIQQGESIPGVAHAVHISAT